MSDAQPQFRVQLRGYEPAQVDRRLEELTAALQEAARQRDELNLRVQSLQEQLAKPVEEAPPAAPATFEHLGERVGQILALAEEEAAELRTKAEAALASERAELGEANARLEQASLLVEQARADAESLQADATREARRAIEEAELQASAIVTDAKALAARVRAESDRELAAATQRRDSINAQLANVRQMLATLTGTAPIALDPFAEAEAASAPVAETGGDSGAEAGGESAAEDVVVPEHDSTPA